MNFYPGMRVRITDPRDAGKEAAWADVLEVVTPERIEDLELPGMPVELVRASMRESGVAAALVLKFVGERRVFVFEQLRDGTFRQFITHEPYTLESVPVEWQEEVQ